MLNLGLASLLSIVIILSVLLAITIPIWKLVSHKILADNHLKHHK